MHTHTEGPHIVCHIGLIRCFLHVVDSPYQGEHVKHSITWSFAKGHDCHSSFVSLQVTAAHICLMHAHPHNLYGTFIPASMKELKQKTSSASFLVRFRSVHEDVKDKKSKLNATHCPYTCRGCKTQLRQSLFGNYV